MNAARDASLWAAELGKSRGEHSTLADSWDEVEAYAAKCQPYVKLLSEEHDGRSLRMVAVCDRKAQEGTPLKKVAQMFKKLAEDYAEQSIRAQSNEGVDWKELMHAVRICEEARELLRDQMITYPRPERDLLLAIRKGEVPYRRVGEMIDAAMEDLQSLQTRSTLPDMPDIGRAEDLIVQAHLDAIRAMP